MNTTPPLSTIFAGETVAAEILNGTKLDVFVRQMPARFLVTKFLMIADDEATILDTVCEAPAGNDALPAGWVDALTDESHAMLVEKAVALNFSRAVAQAERLTVRTRSLQALETQVKSLPNSSLIPR